MSLSAALLVLLGTQGPVEAQAKPGFRLAATATAAGGFFRQYGAIDGQAATADLSLDWYPRRPAVDDGGPLAAAAYLQRLDRLGLGVSGTTLKAKEDGAGNEQTGFSAETWLAALWYRRWAVLGARMSYARAYGRELSAETGAITPAERRSVQRLRPSLTFGVRDGTFELRAVYSWSGYFDEGAFRGPGWGQVEAFARLFVSDRNDLSLHAYTLGRGAGISGTYQHFISPRVRLWLRGTYEEGEIYNQIDVWQQPRYERARLETLQGEGAIDDSGCLGEAGVGFWPSRRWELRVWASGGVVSYSMSVRDEANEGGAAYGDATVIKQFLAHVGIVVRGWRTP
jgi:hypothetical protein